jgi:hypothetical protein
MFNLKTMSDFAAAAAGQAAVADRELSDREVEEFKTTRAKHAAVLDRQAHEDRVKANLCNQIQDMKRACGRDLAGRILDLEQSDPEMFKFVRQLEYIQRGFWCEYCYQMKKLGDAPEDYDQTMAGSEDKQGPSQEVAVIEPPGEPDKTPFARVNLSMQIADDTPDVEQVDEDTDAETEKLLERLRVISQSSSAYRGDPQTNSNQ